ncbi:MAG: mechanosensitive ion channel domain-containing protein, partial [Pseudomonadota bacterium]
GRRGDHEGQIAERIEDHPRLDRVPKVLWVLRMGVIALVLAVSFNIIGLFDAQAWLDSEAGTQMMSALFSVAVIVGISLLIWLSMASWVEYRLNPLFGKPPTARETTLLTLMRNAASILLLVLTLMFSLSQIGLDIAPLLASAGVLGLAIGFGSQKLVQDIITGIFIQLENAMNVGDVVTVGGVSGVVEKLTVRSVSLRDLHGVFHIIPFSSVDSVSNFMRDFAFHVATIGVAYREEVGQVRQAMEDAFAETKANADVGGTILGDLEWMGLESFGESAVELRARIKTLPGKQWAVGRVYNEAIKTIFDARGIEIPFPHQTVYFGEDRTGNAPPVNVRTEDRPRRADAAE